MAVKVGKESMIVIEKGSENIHRIVFGTGKDKIHQKDMNCAVPPLNGF
jgi:hypothetical protein